jgi:hypothetical protein
VAKNLPGLEYMQIRTCAVNITVTDYLQPGAGASITSCFCVGKGKRTAAQQ